MTSRNGRLVAVNHMATASSHSPFCPSAATKEFEARPHSTHTAPRESGGWVAGGVADNFLMLTYVRLILILVFYIGISIGVLSPPDYTYTYPEEWTTISTGCGTGIARQRKEVESCSARIGCGCENSRELEYEEVRQTACPTTPTTGTCVTSSLLIHFVFFFFGFLEDTDGVHHRPP